MQNICISQVDGDLCSGVHVQRWTIFFLAQFITNAKPKLLKIRNPFRRAEWFHFLAISKAPIVLTAFLCVWNPLWTRIVCMSTTAMNFRGTSKAHSLYKLFLSPVECVYYLIWDFCFLCLPHLFMTTQSPSLWNANSAEITLYVG